MLDSHYEPHKLVTQPIPLKDVTLEQLAQTVSKVSGVPIPTRRIPYAVLNVMAHAGELASRITGTQPTLSVNALKVLNRRHEVSAAKTSGSLAPTPNNML